MDFVDWRENPLQWWKENPMMGIDLETISRFRKCIARNFGGCYIGRYQPIGFMRPVKFWMYWSREGKYFYVFYNHGFKKRKNVVTNSVLPPDKLFNQVYWGGYL